MNEVTLAACLTPPGRGAIAVLAIRGPKAWPVVRDLFRSKARLPEAPEPGHFWLGRCGDDPAGKMADQAVLAVKRADWLELHCHGGIEVVRWLLEVLSNRGVETCSWQQLEVRTAADPLQAQAAAALAQAPTLRTAAILLDQLNGAFRTAIDAIRSGLEQKDLQRPCSLLAELARYASVGKHLTTPWNVAVLGAPNVGKSSLVNALAGFQRSVVAAAPGTTRDVVTTRIAVDGWPIELADTAGLREDAGSLEEQGITLARKAAAGADLCLWVLDASAAPVWPEATLPNVHLVINKIDLPPAWDLSRAGDAVRVSAQDGSGLGELCQRLGEWLVPATPPPGAAVPFTADLAELVKTAADLAAQGRSAEACTLLQPLFRHPERT